MKLILVFPGLSPTNAKHLRLKVSSRRSSIVTTYNPTNTITGIPLFPSLKQREAQQQSNEIPGINTYTFYSQESTSNYTIHNHYGLFYVNYDSTIPNCYT